MFLTGFSQYLVLMLSVFFANWLYNSTREEPETLGYLAVSTAIMAVFVGIYLLIAMYFNGIMALAKIAFFAIHWIVFRFESLIEAFVVTTLAALFSALTIQFILHMDIPAVVF